MLEILMSNQASIRKKWVCVKCVSMLASSESIHKFQICFNENIAKSLNNLLKINSKKYGKNGTYLLLPFPI